MHKLHKFFQFFLKTFSTLTDRLDFIKLSQIICNKKIRYLCKRLSVKGESVRVDFDLIQILSKLMKIYSLRFIIFNLSNFNLNGRKKFY